MCWRKSRRKRGSRDRRRRQERRKVFRRYDPRMTWSRAVVAIAATLATAIAPVTAATASPPANLTCTFRLSPPAVEVLPGGVLAVTASVTPKSCTGNAAPIKTTVCISTPGSSGVCAGGTAWSPATAVLPGTHPHGQFTADGQGCWDEPTTMVNPCTSLEPATVTI